MNDQPLTAAELFTAELLLTRARLHTAVAQAADPQVAWPEDLLAAEQALRDRRAEAAADPDHALPILWLQQRLGLTESEERVLWLLIAHELCATSRSLMRLLTTEKVADPTTEALRLVAYGAAGVRAGWRELAADAPLRRLGLIERTDTDRGAPEHRQTWKATSRVIGLAHGDLRLDPELTALHHGAAPDPAGLGGGGLEIDPRAAAELAAAVTSAQARGAGLIIVNGRPGTGRRSLLAHTARTRGLDLFELDVRALATDPAQARHQLRLLARECRLCARTPLLRNLEALTTSTDGVDPLDLIEDELGDLVVLATTARPVARRWRRAPRTIDLAPLTGEQRTRLWARALPMITAEDADGLATMYPIAPALIAAAAQLAVEHAAGAAIGPAHIQAGLRAVLDDRLAGLATRVTVTQTWDDLVLPAEQFNAVVELVSRIRERRTVYEQWGFGAKLGRGLGVAALLSGPPGTGKTMCAGLIARELGTELYQVDLSKIVSKWIGETEKNLAALFDAAEAGHAILLFDEADTLFGKRTDVKSSNDRHANQETNYLLQRLESFAGTCILTTNHDTAIDEAFRRRLSIHVQFPMPEVDERVHLWSTLLPKAAPVAGALPFAELARTYEMSGGYIRNAVLRAAFLAADARTPIAATHLIRAAQLEYQAMGRVMPGRL